MNGFRLSSQDSVSTPLSPLPVVILISGRGSNMMSLIENTQQGKLPIDIRAVISNRPQAQGLKLAREAGIKAIAVDHTEFASRAEFEYALQETIDTFNPGLVILAGFMRILGDDFVNHFQGRMLNIHPSLLPKYPGTHTHRRVLENGDSIHGASIHFVTTELDGGPVVLQVKVPVQADDTEKSLAARVLKQEHIIFSKVVYWFAEGRLAMMDGQVYFNNQPLTEPLTAEYIMDES